jgi:hypothetical protein
MPLSKNIFYLWDVPNDKMEFTSFDDGLFLWLQGFKELNTMQGQLFLHWKKHSKITYIFKES